MKSSKSFTKLVQIRLILEPDIFYCKQRYTQYGILLKSISLDGRLLGFKFPLYFVQLFIHPEVSLSVMAALWMAMGVS